MKKQIVLFFSLLGVIFGVNLWAMEDPGKTKLITLNDELHNILNGRFSPFFVKKKLKQLTKKGCSFDIRGEKYNKFKECLRLMKRNSHWTILIEYLFLFSKNQITQNIKPLKELFSKTNIYSCTKEQINIMESITKLYQETDKNISEMLTSNIITCNICLRSLRNSGDEIVKELFCCEEYVHKSCVEKWLKNNEMCPNCQAKDPLNKKNNSNLKKTTSQESCKNKKNKSQFTDTIIGYFLRNYKIKMNKRISQLKEKSSDMAIDILMLYLKLNNKITPLCQKLKGEYTCSICLKDIKNSKKIINLNCCENVYHSGCITKYLDIASNNTCPACMEIVLNEYARYYCMIDHEGKKHSFIKFADREDDLRKLLTFLQERQQEHQKEWKMDCELLFRDKEKYASQQLKDYLDKLFIHYKLQGLVNEMRGVIFAIKEKLKNWPLNDDELSVETFSKVIFQLCEKTKGKHPCGTCFLTIENNNEEEQSNYCKCFFHKNCVIKCSKENKGCKICEKESKLYEI